MSKKFKTRWIWKSLSWKLLSAATGALVVLWLTGEYNTSWKYLAIYVPITLVLFVAHEYIWQQIKIRHRCAACDGTGVGRIFAGTCSVCEGTGERCISKR
jgi:uncharacterized membrane protein